MKTDKSVLIPLIRKIIPGVIAQDIVGVQPMTGSTGQIFSVSGEYKPTTPWEYLENWNRSDRGPDETLAKLNERMQNRWPGKYKIIVKEVRAKDSMYKVSKHVFEFDTPAEETLFRLKYS